MPRPPGEWLPIAWMLIFVIAGSAPGGTWTVSLPSALTRRPPAAGTNHSSIGPTAVPRAVMAMVDGAAAVGAEAAGAGLDAAGAGADAAAAGTATAPTLRELSPPPPQAASVKARRTGMQTLETNLQRVVG